MKLFGITAPSTGSGKTSVTLGILSNLKNATSFKIGPDYIDPMLSSSITGNQTHNLDRWIQGRHFRKALELASSKFDYGVVEGVMGLHDSGMDMDLSTYFYFRALKIPYILVIDVSKLAESAYYMASGFLGKLALGVIINNYYSEKHLQMVSKPFLEHNVKIIGAIPHSEDLSIPERHLGLFMVNEVENLSGKAREIGRHINMDFLDSVPDVHYPVLKSEIPEKGSSSIWIARDGAFSFYYGSTMEFLERLGEINYFSPVSGEVPENPDFVYFGGGYPELYAKSLSEASKLRSSIRDVSESGIPVIGECGGLMYLESNLSVEGRDYAMSGVFSGSAEMTGHLTLGYTELYVVKDNPLFSMGETVYGHEYHYSNISDSTEKTMKNLRGRGIDGMDGMVSRNTLGSYTHIDFLRYGKRVRKLVKPRL
ncbi:cobyrinic acid a,c-diamide synthase [Thermoplasmatales archaeon]|nr:cobyrinic acid a,c-diamide synthase [Thermoplasmatales archaeon]